MSTKVLTLREHVFLKMKFINVNVGKHKVCRSPLLVQKIKEYPFFHSRKSKTEPCNTYGLQWRMLAPTEAMLTVGLQTLSHICCQDPGQELTQHSPNLQRVSPGKCQARAVALLCSSVITSKVDKKYWNYYAKTKLSDYANDIHNSKRTPVTNTCFSIFRSSTVVVWFPF